MSTNTSSQAPSLPYLCTPAFLLALILVGELMALVITLSDLSSHTFSMTQFGVTSIISQWIVLGSSLVLCQLRDALNNLSPTFCGIASYGLCLLIAAVTLGIAQTFNLSAFDIILWSKSFVIAGICAGIVLRFAFVHQQLINQKQAENDARLESLQARIRPHFLFNSMNTIASLISINPDAAEHMIEDLSEVFRATLKQPAMVPLVEEVSLCEHYLAIEQMRLGDRLRIKWDFAENYPKQLKVPSLLLQPLIENAIVHGIQRLLEGGTIQVKITSNTNQLIITVSNPKPDLPASQSEKGNKMALENIQNRLQVSFGKQAQFTTQKTEQVYTVKIVLPINNNK